MGQQCCKLTSDNYKEEGDSKYINFDEQSMVEQKDYERRRYIFSLRVHIKKKKLESESSIKRIRYFVTYGDILIKDWREDFRTTYGEYYISHSCFLEFYQK